MQREIFQLQSTQWIDITHPQKDHLQNLSDEFAIPLRALQSCLDPEHLPKYESLGDWTFIILRIVDEKKKASADSVQELTTKLALFMKKDILITIHRMPIDFIVNIKESLLKKSPASIHELEGRTLIKDLITLSVMSFDHPIEKLEERVGKFEEHIFQFKHAERLLREGYLIKRRSSAYKKVLKFSSDIILKMISRPDYIWSDFQDVKEVCDRLVFYAEDILENSTSLLNLHVSLASQKTNEASFKTNEVMRMLTIFSIFFLPLNFIAGIYGMNFKYMPELENEYGYYTTLLLMFILSASIFIWIYRKGWLKTPS